MTLFKRSTSNPFFGACPKHDWESRAAFNPSVVKENQTYHLLYRAISESQTQSDWPVSISSIGHAISTDGLDFKDRHPFISPKYHWEEFGCEDPRVTFLEGKYYIFYTALSQYPFSAEGIKVALAITQDFQTIDTKHLITPFNAKAMALFPERINGKIAAVLTVHTDMPPSKIALAFFDHEEDIWSKSYWACWYASLDEHVLPLLRDINEHVEVGAQPIKTEKGWLLLHSYVRHYFSEHKEFSVEAVLLDLENPKKIIGRTKKPLLVPEEIYEIEGDVKNIIFPSGAILENNKVMLYYAAADTRCCMAVADLNELLSELTIETSTHFEMGRLQNGFARYQYNPIIAPRPEFYWEAKSTFNPAAVYEDGKVHIVYRAVSQDDTSVMGYAISRDGIHIDERLVSPIYMPRRRFEMKSRPGNSGCEDPRITKLGDRFYMFYTAFDGYCPRVAFTSISVKDFLAQNWNWDPAKVITSASAPDKDACLFPKKIKDKYVILNRPGDSIGINFLEDLAFKHDQELSHSSILLRPKQQDPLMQKVGIAGPPLETAEGWLLFYHWVTWNRFYEVGAILLDLENPIQILGETPVLLTPEMEYERLGDVPNVVFPCGAVMIEDEIFLYYGGADKVTGVAKMRLDHILNLMRVN